MEIVKALTTKDVLDFFANSAVDKISLFAFFVIIGILLLNTRKDRREFVKSCKSLEAEISKLSKAITKNITADEEKDKKNIQEFNHINSNLISINKNIGLLRNDVTKMHNYCMGKNGYPTQAGGTDDAL
jgi:dolichol kinase